MAKVALLIGVGEYGLGLNPLPSAVKDVEAMQRVLQHPEMGQFDQVKALTNPAPQEMQEEIETLFANRNKDDLILLFFSGHGVKDDSSRLYLATTLTKKTPQGELVKSTAVPASFVNDVMRNSRSKRQVVLLDCCFSGAFAEDMRAKDDGTVDVQTQLGGEGRAVLTSSTSTQYSFEQDGSDLSVYSRFLVEGLETGVADLNGDGVISIDELHDYASGKVREAAPAMQPKIYAVEEGFKIRLAKAPISDPNLNYRKEVERFASRGGISDVARYTLDARQRQLGISLANAREIESQVLKPYQEYQQKLQQYEDVLAKALKRENPLSVDTRQELKRFQEVLGLENRNIEPVEAKLGLLREEVRPQPVSAPQPSTTASPPVQPQYRQEIIDGPEGLARIPTDPTLTNPNRTNQPSRTSRWRVIKWIGGIAVTVISGVVVWHLTEGTKPPERTPQNSPSSYESKATTSPQEQPSQPLTKPLPLSNESPQLAPSSPPAQTNPSPVPLVVPERWKYMGVSTKTGEEIYVDNSSIDKSGGKIRFTYKIGNNLITASADCGTSRWSAKNKNTGEDYGWTSPQSQATRSMMDYVCK